jgi:hypothetical protein
MYSASQVERETMDYRLEDQEIAALPRLKTYPEVNRRVSGSPAQSESVYPESGCKVPRNTRPISAVSWRYQRILSTALMWLLSGFEENRETTETANTRSGRVPSMAYIREPTID